MESVFVVTFKPVYDDDLLIKKAFKTEGMAVAYIKKEERKNRKLIEDADYIGDYDIEEVGLVDG